MAVAPTELGAVDPHAVQNYRQAPGDCDYGTTHAAPLGHSHAPRLQPGPFSAVGEERLRGLVQHRAEHGVAALGYTAVIVNLAGLVSLRRQADMRADRPGVNEALRLINGRPVSQRDDRADAGCCHEVLANRVMADRVEQHLVEDRELLAHHSPDGEQRFHDSG